MPMIIGELYMKKTLISLLLICCVVFTGCVSKAEFDALEERVSRLENNNGYSVQNQSASTNGETSDENSLSFYVKNWDEVTTIIGQVLNKTDCYEMTFVK